MGPSLPVQECCRFDGTFDPDEQDVPVQSDMYVKQICSSSSDFLPDWDFADDFQRLIVQKGHFNQAGSQFVTWKSRNNNFISGIQVKMSGEENLTIVRQVFWSAENDQDV